jgi:hypothetical protein
MTARTVAISSEAGQWRLLARKELGLHEGGACELFGELLLLVLQFAAQGSDLPTHAETRQRAIEGGLKLAAIERLAQIVVRSMAKRRNRHLLRAVGRRQDHGHVEPLGSHVIEHVDPGHP